MPDFPAVAQQIDSSWSQDGGKLIDESEGGRTRVRYQFAPKRYWQMTYRVNSTDEQAILDHFNAWDAQPFNFLDVSDNVTYSVIYDGGLTRSYLSPDLSLITLGLREV